MGIIALARSQRPRSFQEVYGQEHVTSALSNAIKLNHLHHAYLLTGSRGVGKTTIARILAKVLNCENVIDAAPCLTCSSCLEIDSGSALDFIEIDGASRTKVEDTKEIIDSIAYANARYRYKIYLIDEVHMLSTHSFNALLKTLEEPPDHIKFILATTEPHKIPVTIMSRCLKFNLNLLTQDQLSSYITDVCIKERISIDPDACALIAKAANGSARDALSLLDHAILLQDQQKPLSPHTINKILGMDDEISSEFIFSAITNNDKSKIINISDTLYNKGVALSKVIDQLLVFLHQKIVQTPTHQLLKCFEILIKNKEYITLAPNQQIGFEILLISAMPKQGSNQSSNQGSNQGFENNSNISEAETDIKKKNLSFGVKL